MGRLHGSNQRGLGKRGGVSGDQKSVGAITKAVLLLGANLTLMSGAALSPGATAMLAEFEALPNAQFWVSMILTFHALFVVIGGPIAGYLTDRIGRKPVLVMALLLGGISGSAGFFLNSIGAILVTRALVGISIAGAMTATNALITDLFEGSSRSRFMGIQSAVTGLAGMIFLPLGGVLADINWHYAFLSYLPLLILFPLAVIFVHEPAVIEQENDERIAAKLHLDWKKVYIFALTLIAQFSYMTVPLFLAYYLAASVGASSTAVGILGAISSVISFLGGWLYGWMEQRASFEKLALVNALLFGVGFLVLGLATSWELVILAEVILGFCMGLNSSNLPTWLASEVGLRVRGRANGIYVMMTYLGQFATPIVFSPLTNQVGYGAVYLIVAGLMALAGLGALLLPRDAQNS